MGFDHGFHVWFGRTAFGAFELAGRERVGKQLAREKSYGTEETFELAGGGIGEDVRGRFAFRPGAPTDVYQREKVEDVAQDRDAVSFPG